jgi:hypothetical protein
MVLFIGPEPDDYDIMPSMVRVRSRQHVRRAVRPHQRHDHVCQPRRQQCVPRQSVSPGEGPLYPALYRMVEAGWIRSEWAASHNNRRARYCKIAAAERRRLTSEEGEWRRAADAITRVLRMA